MIKKLIFCWFVLVGLSFGIESGVADGFGLWGFFTTTNVTRTPSSIPTFVPGTNVALIPRSQTPLDPSVSQDGPRCLPTGVSDTSWGPGCDNNPANTTFTHCFAPTSGAPLQSCQSPLQLFLSSADQTASTGNGTAAVVHYHSVANFAYAASQPLMITGATQANWNTPDVHLSSHWVESNSDALCPSSGPSMEVGFVGPYTTAPFVVGQFVYFSGLSPANGTGLGWGQNVVGAPQPNARHQLVQVTTTTAKFCMSLMPLTTPTITTAGTATTIGATATTFTNVALTTTTGAGSGALATIVASNTGVSTITVTNWGNAAYKPSDTFSIATGVGNLTGFVGTIATISTLGLNHDGFAARAVAPWVVSSSSCALTVCTVTFGNPYTCASSCVSSTTQIVAGQFSDDIVAWHYGENVPMKTFISGQNVVICLVADSIGPQQYIAVEGDGGLYTKITTPTPDPWGPGGPWPVDGVGTISQPFAAARDVYCAQAPSSTFVGDGEHEIRAIAVPVVGYPTQLTSVQAIDGSNATPYFTANSHGKKDWSYQGITNSFDANFPNYNWNTTNASYAFSDGTPVALSSVSANGSSMTATWSIATSSVVPPIAGFQVGQYIGLTNLDATNNSCTVTGGTAALPFVTLNLSGTCNFPAGSKINVASVANSGSTWNGNNIIVTTGTGAGCNPGTCTVTYAALSTGAWVSGGVAKATLTGICHITAVTTNTFTCPNLASAGTTAAQAGGCPTGNPNCLTNTGNTMCVVGGNGDNPAPYTQFNVALPALGSQMTPDSFQLLPRLGNVITCTLSQNATGCQLDLITHTTPCGILPSQAETLWSWDKDAGRAQGDGGTAKTMVGSYFFFTNAGGTIKSSRVYVNAWSPSSVTTGLCRNTAQFPAGSSISDAPSVWAGATCQNLTLALFGLAPQINTLVQTVAQVTGTTQCTVFEHATNVGATPLYTGEPIDFIAGLDTNSGTDSSTGLAMPEFSTFAQYWIVGTGRGSASGGTGNDTGNANGVILALRPGGPCINEPTTLIVNNTTAGTARLGPDVSFDEVLFRCDTTLANPCSGSHPETYPLKPTIAAGVSTEAAEAGWLNLDPDLAFGTTSAQVSFVQGGSGILTGFSELSARLHTTISNIDKEISFSPVNTVGPTPAQVTVTSGSLASCPTGSFPWSGHQCETLNFAAQVDNLAQANGATFQPANAATGFPGQPIWVMGFTSTTWNCGTSPVLPCLGNNGTTAAGIVSSTPTSVTFVNDGATGSATGTGSIAGVSLIFEAPAGTFAPACTTSGQVPINTTGSTYCMLNDQATGASYGSNQYSLPIYTQPYGAVGTIANTLQLADTANCLSSVFGQFTVATILNRIIPASVGGTTNDLVIMNQSQNAPHGNPNGVTQALNQCIGPIKLVNNGFGWPGGYTELWQDSLQRVGPLFVDPHGTDAAPLSAEYLTNVLSYNRADSWGGSAYSWGNQSVYSLNCLSSGEVFISTWCTSGADRVPRSFSGTQNPDGSTWEWVNKGWDAAGNPTLCGGVDCLGDAASTDSHQATVSFGIPVGSLPALTSISWNATAVCNLTGLSTFGNGGIVQLLLGFVSGFNNAASAHAPSNSSLNINGSIIGKCIIPTGTPGPGWPAVYINDASHIDYNFWLYNADIQLPTQVVNGGSNWMHWKDLIERNVGCICGTNEQYMAQGGSYVNIAVDDANIQFLDAIQPQNISTVISVALNATNTDTNIIFQRDAFTTLARVSPVPGFLTYRDYYFINDTGGTNTQWPNPSGDAFNQGFESASQNATQAYTGAGTQGGGYTENAAIVPTGARYVDPATGLPVGPAQDPMYNSFLAEPWYGPGSLTGDSGLGTW